MNNLSIHVPVLLREVLSELNPHPNSIYIDGTLGGAGHASEILKKAGPDSKIIGLDRDPMMIQLARQKLQSVKFKNGQQAQEGLHFHTFHSPYSNLRTALDEVQLSQVDGILLDLGYSSDQLLDNTRGFSFNHTEKLDLRFDTNFGIPADEFLNTVDEQTLKMILQDYGEESQAGLITKAIIHQRKSINVWTPQILADLVSTTVRSSPKDSKTHPATQTFQALRIAVNKELDILQQFLEHTAAACLKPGGKLVIITFHSLEDRMVKQALKNQEIWVNVPAKPILVTPQEARFNPRSRSAKLRIATFRG